MRCTFNPKTTTSLVFKILVGLLLYGALSIFYTPGLITIIVIAAILDTVEVT